jgi:hypothetical protein
MALTERIGFIMDSLEKKYYSDVPFRALVDMLFQLMYSNKYKSDEIIDASEMAFLKYENCKNFKK